MGADDCDPCLYSTVEKLYVSLKHYHIWGYPDLACQEVDNCPFIAIRFSITLTSPLSNPGIPSVFFSSIFISSFPFTQFLFLPLASYHIYFMQTKGFTLFSA